MAKRTRTRLGGGAGVTVPRLPLQGGGTPERGHGGRGWGIPLSQVCVVLHLMVRVPCLAVVQLEHLGNAMRSFPRPLCASG